MKNKNILQGSLCYLAGPIDKVLDQGKGWRTELIAKCDDEMDVKFFDPTNKLPNLTKEVDEEQEKIRLYKKTGEWGKLSTFMREVVHVDHRMVDYCDFIVCYIDMDVHMCGTYFELQSALTEKKPYCVIIKGGKQNAPSWLFGILDHNRMFNSVDEVVERLCKLNSGETPLDDRWVLIRKEIENL